MWTHASHGTHVKVGRYLSSISSIFLRYKGLYRGCQACLASTCTCWPDFYSRIGKNPPFCGFIYACQCRNLHMAFITIV